MKKLFKAKQISKLQTLYYSNASTKHLLIFTFAFASLISACSEDENNSLSTEKNEVSTIYELGQCNANRQSEISFIIKENAYYICNNNNWNKWIEAISSSSIFNSQEVYYSSSFFPSLAETPPVEVVNGYVTDPRDGHSYRVTTIGNQTWMAENLNYETDNSLCFDNLIDNCTKYGRLYNFHDKTYKDPCPAGWHSASLYDWRKLFENIGISSNADPYTISHNDVVNPILSLIATGWVSNTDGKSTDTYGFSAIPAGYSLTNINFTEYHGDIAFFWISTGDNCIKIYFNDITLSFWEEVQFLKYGQSCSANEMTRLADEYASFSIRCVKD